MVVQIIPLLMVSSYTTTTTTLLTFLPFRLCKHQLPSILIIFTFKSTWKMVLLIIVIIVIYDAVWR